MGLKGRLIPNRISFLGKEGEYDLALAWKYDKKTERKRTPIENPKTLLQRYNNKMNKS